MQKTISIAFLLGILVFGFSNFTSSPKSSFIMTVVNEEPVLPEIPFDYSIIVPDHLADPDTPPIGYSAGEIKSFDIDDLENDIVTLGRVLFYDEKLSAMENISCGTCHDQSLSFTENKPVSEGISSETLRNSMHLNDLGWSNNEHFAWDLRRENLSQMIELPLTDDNEIGANLWEISTKLEHSSYYPDLFEKAYGDRTVVVSRIIEAIKQFIASMHTFESKFDQEAASNFAGFNDQELEGLRLFQDNCSTCHNQGQHTVEGVPSSSNILDVFPFIFNNGLPADPDDKGVGEWQSDKDGLFKVPTLRNIELTAPYMHDGRFNNLDEVIEHYSENVEQNQWSRDIPDGGFKFNLEEKSALKAFMMTLTDDTFISSEKWSNPFQQQVLSADETTFFEDLVLRPNPMSDRAVIEFKNENHQLVSINVMTSDGRLMKHDNTTTSQYILEKDLFEPGLYYIQLIMDNAKSTQKLIVQ